MRVLFLSVTAGEGHNSCAKAIISSMNKRGIECRLLNALKYSNRIIGDSIDKGYLLLGKISPKVLGRMYSNALTSSIKGKLTLTELVSPIMAKKLADYIEIYEPDCIICTHVFASLVVTNVREKHKFSVPVIGINTDYTIHPYWELVDQEYFVLACDKMNYSAQSRNFQSNKLLPFGIPVHERFNTVIPHSEARASLGLTDKTTLTLMGGSMGYGNLVDAIRQLDRLKLDFQMVTICGNNKRMYNKLESIRPALVHDLRNFGFVDDVRAYMCAANVLITKPGGLSVSECLLMRRPLILLNPIPGQEEYNAAFLTNLGAAVHASHFYSLEEAVYNLLTSPERIQRMIESQSAIYTGNASEKLTDFVTGLLSRTSENH